MLNFSRRSLIQSICALFLFPFVNKTNCGTLPEGTHNGYSTGKFYTEINSGAKTLECRCKDKLQPKDLGAWVVPAEEGKITLFKPENFKNRPAPFLGRVCSFSCDDEKCVIILC